MQAMLTAFVHLIGFYFIGRDYNSFDPTVEKLNLLDCTLDFRYQSTFSATNRINS